MKNFDMNNRDQTDSCMLSTGNENENKINEERKHLKDKLWSLYDSNQQESQSSIVSDVNTDDGPPTRISLCLKGMQRQSGGHETQTKIEKGTEKYAGTKVALGDKKIVLHNESFSSLAASNHSGEGRGQFDERETKNLCKESRRIHLDSVKRRRASLVGDSATDINDAKEEEESNVEKLKSSRKMKPRRSFSSDHARDLMMLREQAQKGQRRPSRCVRKQQRRNSNFSGDDVIRKCSNSLTQILYVDNKRASIKRDSIRGLSMSLSQLSMNTDESDLISVASFSLGGENESTGSASTGTGTGGKNSKLGTPSSKPLLCHDDDDSDSSDLSTSESLAFEEVFEPTSESDECAHNNSSISSITQKENATRPTLVSSSPALITDEVIQPTEFSKVRSLSPPPTKSEKSKTQKRGWGSSTAGSRSLSPVRKLVPKSVRKFFSRSQPTSRSNSPVPKFFGPQNKPSAASNSPVADSKERKIVFNQILTRSPLGTRSLSPVPKERTMDFNQKFTKSPPATRSLSPVRKNAENPSSQPSTDKVNPSGVGSTQQVLASNLSQPKEIEKDTKSSPSSCESIIEPKLHRNQTPAKVSTTDSQSVLDSTQSTDNNKSGRNTRFSLSLPKGFSQQKIQKDDSLSALLKPHQELKPLMDEDENDESCQFSLALPQGLQGTRGFGKPQQLLRSTRDEGNNRPSRFSLSLPKGLQEVSAIAETRQKSKPTRDEDDKQSSRLSLSIPKGLKDITVFARAPQASKPNWVGNDNRSSRISLSLPMGLQDISGLKQEVSKPAWFEDDNGSSQFLISLPKSLHEPDLSRNRSSHEPPHHKKARGRSLSPKGGDVNARRKARKHRSLSPDRSVQDKNDPQIEESNINMDGNNNKDAMTSVFSPYFTENLKRAKSATPNDKDDPDNITSRPKPKHQYRALSPKRNNLQSTTTEQGADINPSRAVQTCNSHKQQSIIHRNESRVETSDEDDSEEEDIKFIEAHYSGNNSLSSFNSMSSFSSRSSTRSSRLSVSLRQIMSTQLQNDPSRHGGRTPNSEDEGLSNYLNVSQSTKKEHFSDRHISASSKSGGIDEKPDNIAQTFELSDASESDDDTERDLSLSCCLGLRESNERSLDPNNNESLDPTIDNNNESVSQSSNAVVALMRRPRSGNTEDGRKGSDQVQVRKLPNFSACPTSNLYRSKSSESALQRRLPNTLPSTGCQRAKSTDTSPMKRDVRRCRSGDGMNEMRREVRRTRSGDGMTEMKKRSVRRTRSNDGMMGMAGMNSLRRGGQRPKRLGASDHTPRLYARDDGDDDSVLSSASSAVSKSSDLLSDSSKSSSYRRRRAKNDRMSMISLLSDRNANRTNGDELHSLPPPLPSRIVIRTANELP